MEKSGAKRCPCQGDTLNRFVQPTVLALLLQGSDHGYSIVQKISELGLWNHNTPDTAGVYRALRDMEDRGLITSCLSSDSQAGLGKRVFTLTDSGRSCCQTWIGTLRQYQKDLDEVIGLLEKETE